ncbi:unnamed protein product [Rotaria magnacalcarata]
MVGYFTIVSKTTNECYHNGSSNESVHLDIRFRNDCLDCIVVGAIAFSVDGAHMFVENETCAIHYLLVSLIVSLGLIIAIEVSSESITTGRSSRSDGVQSYSVYTKHTHPGDD